MASMIDVSDKFGKAYSADCMGLNLTLHTANGQKNQPLGTPTQIVMHWTAGDYRGVWDDYHFNIAFDRSAKRACIVKTLDLTQKGQHLWKRNTGAIGVSFCAMADTRFPVTSEQLEAAAELLAELCLKFNWSVEKITDHADWAKKDGYFPDRWDIGNLLPVVKAETKKIMQEIKSGKRKPSMESLLK